MRTYLPILCIALLTLIPFHSEAVEVDLSAVELPEKTAETLSEFNSDLADLEQRYLAAVEELKADTISDLEKQSKRERDPLKSLKIAAEIQTLREMGGPTDLLGNPIRKPVRLLGKFVVGDIGIWEFSENRGELHLNELSTKYHSTAHAQIGDQHVFQWANGDAIVVTHGDSGLTVTNYRDYYDGRNLSDTDTFDTAAVRWQKIATPVE